MVHTILDGSRFAEKAISLVVVIAKRTRAELHLALVYQANLRGPQFDLATRRAEWTYLDQTAARVGESSGLKDTAGVSEEGPVTPGLCGYAAAVSADLIVLTTHGRGPLFRIWLGNVADELLRHATIPVLVHRPTPNKPDLRSEFCPHRVLVTLDGSATATWALAPATELARHFGAVLRLLRVVEPMPFMAATPDDSLFDVLASQASTNLVHVAAELRHQDLNVETKVVLNQPAAVSILGAAEWADPIVLAAHGRGRVARFRLGSVTDKVVCGASCPVLVVRSPSPAGGSS